MNLVVYRSWKLPTYTIGRLLIEAEYQCNTLEDPVRQLLDDDGDGQLEGKVWGATAIPEGKYRITMSFSPKFKRRLPLLNRVPGFTGVRIHAGNSAADTAGCILVGENKIRGRLINSRCWENVIVEKIEAAITAGEKVYITIYNN